jgi:hypothetical protein
MKKPPGATCPQIDKTQSVLRKLHWRVKNPDHGGEDELLRKGLALLEDVREENRQMREAYYDMKRRLNEL